jgi:hypothetical protein
MVVPVSAFDLPDLYGGVSYGSKSKLRTAALSDVFGKYGVALAVGAVESRGPAIGVSMDVDYVVEKLGLEFKWIDRLKIAGGADYSFTEENFEGFGFGAIIRVDLP